MGDNKPSMSNLTSSSAWKAISAVNGPVDLRKYTKIKPDVASQLSCDQDLDLSGLKDLSPALAVAFKHHRGGLLLGGLTSLSLETAQALKENFKGSLEFSSMEALEDDVAMELSQREAGDGSWKYWPKALFPAIKKFEDTPGHLALFTKLVKGCSPYDVNLREVTPVQAQILIDNADDIRYSSINTLSKETAEVLAKSSKKITLSDIKQLDVDVAMALAEHTGDLELSGLEFVSDELAMALSKHKGKVSVGGLKTMPDTEGYLALAKKLVEGNKERFLGNMEVIGSKVAEIFSTCENVYFASLKEIQDTSGFRKLVEKACNVSEGQRVTSYGLKSIPDGILAIFASCPHPVELGGLEKWEEGEGHIAWATRLTKSDPSAGNYSVYAQGEFFPDKIAQIFADPESKVEVNNIRKFDGSPGNVALAKKLASGSKYLNLTAISAEVAKVYVGGSNTNWNFGSLEKIDPETFQILFANKDNIYVDIKEISPEVAKLTEGEKTLGFPHVKEISLDVAKSFANGTGSLSLRGLQTAEDAVLTELAKRSGGELILGEILCLTDQQAEILGRSKSSLSLSKLKEISQDGLSKLLDLDPSLNISLPELKDISDANAAKLAGRQGGVDVSSIEVLEDSEGYLALAKKIAQSWRVELKGLIKLGPKAAELLATKSNLNIKGLSTITPEVAEALAKVTDGLDLNDLNEVSMEVAQKLSSFTGALTLGNVDNISDEEFAILVANKKRLSFSATHLSPVKAMAISKIPNLYITGLETIEFEAAKCFKGYKGEIYLMDLCKLSPEAAKELRKLRRRLGTRRAGEYALATGE
jgi:hypothetical protein